jgi:hypothetical protein
MLTYGSTVYAMLLLIFSKIWKLTTYDAAISIWVTICYFDADFLRTGGKKSLVYFSVFRRMYGFLQGAWPFGLVEAVWAGIAMRKWIYKNTSPPSGSTTQ